MAGIKEERATIVAKYGERFRCYGEVKPECLETHGYVMRFERAGWLINQIPEPCRTCLLKYATPKECMGGGNNG